MLTRNVLQHTANWKPTPTRTAVYIGDPAGKRHLESAGFDVSLYNGGNLSADQMLGNRTYNTIASSHSYNVASLF